MKVALAQFEAARDKDANLARIADLAQQAKVGGADLVIFPEAAMYHLSLDESLVATAESLEGPFVAKLSEFARTNAIALVAGVFESIPDHDRVFNTVVVFDADGSHTATYRKIHLFDAFGFRESDWVEPGVGDTVVVPIQEIAVGVMTCYDVRFPEIARHLTNRGAQLIALPAAWAHGLLKEEHWKLLVRARALENTIYVAAAGQVGAGTSGRSMLVDPMGVAIVDAGETEGVVVAPVSQERLAQVREKLPSLGNSRSDIYGQWLPVER